MADDLGQHELRGVAGDRKADALRAADDRGVDADYLGRRRHQRAAGIAGVERGVGLDHVLDGPAAHRANRAAQRRNHAGVTVNSNPKRIADRDHKLAAAQISGIAERSVTQIPCAVGPQQRQIGVGIDAEYAGIGYDAFDILQPDLSRRPTTWLLVSTSPSGEITMPEPSPPPARASVSLFRAGFDPNDCRTRRARSHR